MFLTLSIESCSPSRSVLLGRAPALCWLFWHRVDEVCVDRVEVAIDVLDCPRTCVVIERAEPSVEATLRACPYANYLSRVVLADRHRVAPGACSIATRRLDHECVDTEWTCTWHLDSMHNHRMSWVLCYVRFGVR